MIDPDGTIVYASPSWSAVLGYEPDEVVGTSLAEYTHPDDLPRGLDAIATQAAGTEVASVITRRRTKDGRWLHIESSSTPVFDADGNVTYIIGSARNVTESEELRQRVRELNALYRVADAVARTTDLDELFAEALDALIDATAADRASLLLYDDDGVMRFHTWRGLSDAYRAATEGHSPWTRGTTDPEPVLVADADSAEFAPEVAVALRAEGIAALAFVPIVHAGQLLGKFMLYANEPRAWEEREVRLCLTIANHLGSATERFLTRGQLRASREQLETIMRTVDEGIVVQSVEGERVYANDGAARSVGFATAAEFLAASRDQVLGQFEILDEDLQPLPADELPGRRALSGETAERVICYRIRATGEERWSLVRANPVRDEAGNVVASVSVIHDITALRTSEQQAREAAALVESVFRNAPVGLAFWDTQL